MLKRLLMIGAIGAAAWYLLRRRGGQSGEADGGSEPADRARTDGRENAVTSTESAAGGQAGPAAGGAKRGREAGPSQPSAISPTQAAEGSHAGQQFASQAAAGPGAEPAAGERAQPPSPPSEQPARTIKGNDRGGQKLYHLPEDETYDQVIEERLFATREEAEAAGYHHAQQPS